MYTSRPEMRHCAEKRFLITSGSPLKLLWSIPYPVSAKVAVLQVIGTKMLPLSRRLPSISKGISCATSSKRLYAYAASPLNEPLADTQTGAGEGVDLTPQSVQVTTLENGLRVASLETHSPKSRIGLFINAASRHETPSTLGITHALRSAAFLGNVDYSGFRITRELEHYGATLEATCNRENLVYSADCLRSNIGLVVDNLANIVKKPTFYGWEVDQVTDRLKLDLAIKDAQPPINVVEELHRVAFRKTLGNSLYCLPHRTGKFSSELLKEYTQECYVGQRMTLVGVGVDHSQLVDWAKSTLSFLPKGEPATKEAAKYHGGEVVHFSSGPLVHAVLATEGASLGSKDLLTLSVYQKILGATPYIKWGSNSISNRLLMTATESTSGAVAASAFNASYSDSGLFGFYVVAEPSDVSKVMKSVIGQFSKASKGEISDQEVTRAKNQMKAHILMNGESQETLFEDIGSQISTKGSYTAPQEVAAAVDSVTKADILTVAKRVFSGKPSLSAIGDVSMMPGLDELM